MKDSIWSEIFVEKFLGEPWRAYGCPNQDKVTWMVYYGSAILVVTLLLLLSVVIGAKASKLTAFFGSANCFCYEGVLKVAVSVRKKAVYGAGHFPTVNKKERRESRCRLDRSVVGEAEEGKNEVPILMVVGDIHAKHL